MVKKKKQKKIKLTIIGYKGVNGSKLVKDDWRKKMRYNESSDDKEAHTKCELSTYILPKDKSPMQG